MVEELLRGAQTMKKSDQALWIFMIVVAVILLMTGRVVEGFGALLILGFAWWYQQHNSRNR
jgi:TRAP-type C4-dicarboxylate transport system permease large subunit